MRSKVLMAMPLLLALVAGACRGTNTQTTGAYANLAGTVAADGSSTVFLITQAIAEEFGKEARKVDVTVGTKGTGGGFEVFCAGDSDIQDASRPIKDEEAAECQKNNVEYVELQIAIDGLSIATNSKNTFAKCLTVAELKSVFQPDSAVTNWNQIRKEFPNKGIRLYSPGTDSGTFDYFTAEIVGKEGASRNDSLISFSEDDNQLVRGVVGDDGESDRPLGLGYFGFGYYEQNTDKLKALGVDGGEGCVAPTRETVASGEYAPLSRALFIYVSKASVDKPEVKAFVDFYLDSVSEILPDVGYVEVPESDLEKERKEWEEFAA